MKMAVLFYGANSALNQAIVPMIASEVEGQGGLVWLMTDSSEAEMPAEIPGVTIYQVDRSEEAGKHLKGITTDSKGSFKGVVFAEGTGGVRPLKLNSAAFIEQMFRLNTFTFFELIRGLLKERLLAEGASVVGLSSVSSIRGLKSKTVYSASKAALDAAVRGMAAELAAKKIRVNSIQKGWVDVDMELDFIKDNMQLSGGSDFSEQPLGAVPATELGRLTCFLLSDQVTTLTGVNLLLDGGYCL